MLDERDVERSPQSSQPEAAPSSPTPSSPERHRIDPLGAPGLAETWRELFARLTRRSRAIAPQAEAAPCGETGPCAGLRAEAQAAFRSVDGSSEAALDAALAVLERRINALQQAAGCYGEALKTIQVYSADEASRATARHALRAAPERLAAAQPVPHLAAPGRRF